MIKHLAMGGLASLLLASATTAQAFNIDINVSPSTTPSNTYGAYPSQEGVWSGVAVVGGAQQLSTLAGTPDDTDATFVSVPGTGFNAGIPAPFTELYEDCAIGNPGGYSMTFDDLDAGEYVAVVYSFSPGREAFFRMRDDFGSVNSQQVVSNPATFPAQGFVLNETYALLPFTIFTQGGTAQLDVLAETSSALNGVQLVRYVGTETCPQPFANSTGGFPGIIATGTVSGNGILASANDMRLHVGVLPGALPNGVGSILAWVSNDDLANVPYACPLSGTRCIGLNNLVRMNDPNAAPGSGGVGMTTPFGTYAIDVDLNVLAAQGINVSPGAKLYFQMVYRDTDYMSQCPSAGGVVGRWTNAVEVLLN